MSIPATSLAVGPEAAMALSAAPMPMGPIMIPSMAVTNSSRWMTFMNLMALVMARSHLHWKMSHENVQSTTFKRGHGRKWLIYLRVYRKFGIDYIW